MKFKMKILTEILKNLLNQLKNTSSISKPTVKIRVFFNALYLYDTIVEIGVRNTMKCVPGFLIEKKHISRISLPSEIRWDALIKFLTWWCSFGVICVWLKANVEKIKSNESLKKEVEKLPAMTNHVLAYYKRVLDRVNEYKRSKYYFEKLNHRPGMLVQTLKCMQLKGVGQNLTF